MTSHDPRHGAPQHPPHNSPIIIQPVMSPAAQEPEEATHAPYGGPPLWSYGFRPFFLAGALFAGLALPVWALILAGMLQPDLLYPAREWHVHEMLFGFLAAVMAGFILTAVPNWTDRAPVRGPLLMTLAGLWLAGRVAMSSPSWGVGAAVIDGAFLLLLVAVVWRELVSARSWPQAPIAILLSLYALANLLFHRAALQGLSTDWAEHLAIAVDLMLLTLLGGRLAPNFTREWLAQKGLGRSLQPIMPLEAATLGSVLLALILWLSGAAPAVTGGLFVVAGLVSLVRLSRWFGWLTVSEPLVCILHVGYTWVALSLLALGGSILGVGLSEAAAAHLLTAGAVGAMTLAVMTRASLGHTGRVKRANASTTLIYLLVTLGALVRIVTPDEGGVAWAWLIGIAALSWGGAYLLFALIYGPYLLSASLDD